MWGTDSVIKQSGRFGGRDWTGLQLGLMANHLSTELNLRLHEMRVISWLAEQLVTFFELFWFIDLFRWRPIGCAVWGVGLWQRACWVAGSNPSGARTSVSCECYVLSGSMTIPRKTTKPSYHDSHVSNWTPAECVFGTLPAKWRRGATWYSVIRGSCVGFWMRVIFCNKWQLLNLLASETWYATTLYV